MHRRRRCHRTAWRSKSLRCNEGSLWQCLRLRIPWLDGRLELVSLRVWGLARPAGRHPLRRLRRGGGGGQPLPFSRRPPPRGTRRSGPRLPSPWDPSSPSPGGGGAWAKTRAELSWAKQCPGSRPRLRRPKVAWRSCRQAMMLASMSARGSRSPVSAFCRKAAKARRRRPEKAAAAEEAMRALCAEGVQQDCIPLPDLALAFPAHGRRGNRLPAARRSGATGTAGPGCGAAGRGGGSRRAAWPYDPTAHLPQRSVPRLWISPSSSPRSRGGRQLPSLLGRCKSRMWRSVAPHRAAPTMFPSPRTSSGFAATPGSAYFVCKRVLRIARFGHAWLAELRAELGCKLEEPRAALGAGFGARVAQRKHSGTR